MMTRTVLGAVLVALGALVAPGAVSAADELGATIESTLYADEDRTLDLWNRSTIPATFTFETSGLWAVEPRTLTLAPDALGAVEVVSIGTDPAQLAVRIAATESPPAGAQASELLLMAKLYATRPVDWRPWAVGIALLSATAAAFLAYAHARGRRHARLSGRPVTS